MNPLHLILDTNIRLDWLVFRDPAIAPIQSSVSSNRAPVFIDQPCCDELTRVLSYPRGKFTLDGAAQAAALAECRRIARWIETRIDSPDPLPSFQSAATRMTGSSSTWRSRPRPTC